MQLIATMPMANTWAHAYPREQRRVIPSIDLSRRHDMVNVVCKSSNVYTRYMHTNKHNARRPDFLIVRRSICTVISVHVLYIRVHLTRMDTVRACWCLYILAWIPSVDPLLTPSFHGSMPRSASLRSASYHLFSFILCTLLHRASSPPPHTMPWL